MDVPLLKVHDKFIVFIDLSIKFSNNLSLFLYADERIKLKVVCIWIKTA